MEKLVHISGYAFSQASVRLMEQFVMNYTLMESEEAQDLKRSLEAEVKFYSRISIILS